MPESRVFHFCILLTVFSGAGAVNAAEARLMIHPPQITLNGSDREHGLLVTLINEDGRKSDVTAQAKFTSSAADTITVDAKGSIRGLRDGSAEIAVTCAGQSARVPVVVRETSVQAEPSFRQDVLPILTKSGCNMGSCHGKLSGQNGFRLSLRGFAPEWDHDWLTKEVGSRRIDVAFPADSLILQKTTGTLAHEGGVRFKPGSRFERALMDWISARAPGPVAEEEDAARLEILPGDHVMKVGETQQLLVRAHYANGRVRDVTWLAQFFSNDESILKVKPDGMVKVLRSGEGTVRVHFQGQVEVMRFSTPYDSVVTGADFGSTNNVLDAPIFTKLRDLRLPPSPLCDDQTFIRRAFLDTIGALPQPEEVAAFLADTRTDKRARLVDALLKRPEWIDYWTLQLADLLQNRKERDHDVRGTKGVRSFHAWLRSQLAANKPWNEITRSVLLATGDVKEHPEVGYFLTVVGEKQRTEESELPDSVAQSFLGTRIGCARCHNHPLEKYTQDDFYHFAAYFSKISLKRASAARPESQLTTMPREEEEQLKRVTDAEEKLNEALRIASDIGEELGSVDALKQVKDRQREYDEASKRLTEARAKQPGVTQPRTSKMMAPQPLDRAPWTFEAGRDPREQFVEWMLKSDQFSGAMINRLWKHFFNTGLVEPVDDLRASNPPSNGQLWSVLTREFTEHGYDLQHIMRLILNSRAYQLASDTLAENQTDTRFYSHYYARRLPAEVLLDAIAGATDVPAKFDGYPVGVRAAQLADPGVTSYFLTLFGRSDRVTACACERQGEVTLPQLLHLHNSDDLQLQINNANGRLKALLKNSDDQQVTDSIFLSTLNRKPNNNERAALAKSLAADKREAVFADLFWALLNSKEFAFNH